MPLSSDNRITPPTRAVYAIVPAAGQSRRMGGSKQLMNVGDRPMLHAVVECLSRSTTTGVVVVTRRQIEAALNLSGVDRVCVTWNEDAASEMIDSVRIGLREWMERGVLTTETGLLVCPGDLPDLTVEDVDACIATWREDPRQIVIASHGGRRGHPLIFPASLAEFVESPACDQGLSALPRQHATSVVTIERPTASVLRDVDRPEDLGE
jgi:molybdenum cofactor cytidylyltransferase